MTKKRAIKILNEWIKNKDFPIKDEIVCWESERQGHIETYTFIHLIKIAYELQTLHNKI